MRVTDELEGGARARRNCGLQKEGGVRNKAQGCATRSVAVKRSRLAKAACKRGPCNRSADGGELSVEGGGGAVGGDTGLAAGEWPDWPVGAAIPTLCCTPRGGCEGEDETECGESRSAASGTGKGGLLQLVVVLLLLLRVPDDELEDASRPSSGPSAWPTPAGATGSPEGARAAACTRAAAADSPRRTWRSASWAVAGMYPSGCTTWPPAVLPFCCPRVFLADPARASDDDAWEELLTGTCTGHRFTTGKPTLGSRSGLAFAATQRSTPLTLCFRHFRQTRNDPRARPMTPAASRWIWVCCRGSPPEVLPCPGERMPVPAPPAAPVAAPRAPPAETSPWCAQGPPSSLAAVGPTRSWLFVPLLHAAVGRLTADAGQQSASHTSQAIDAEPLASANQDTLRQLTDPSRRPVEPYGPLGSEIQDSSLMRRWQ